MKYILISVLMIIIGLIGILKNKRPKYEDGPGFAINTNFYLMFYMLFIMGIIFLIIEVKSYFQKSYYKIEKQYGIYNYLSNNDNNRLKRNIKN